MGKGRDKRKRRQKKLLKAANKQADPKRHRNDRVNFYSAHNAGVSTNTEPANKDHAPE